MTSGPSTTETEAPGVPVSRAAPFLAGIWLFFLLEPLAEAWDDRDEPRGLLGIVTTLLFACVYLSLWLGARGGREMRGRPELSRALAHLVVQTALGVTMVVLIGPSGAACSPYIAVGAIMVLPVRQAGVVVALLVMADVVLFRLADAGSPTGLLFGVLAASVAVLGVRTVVSRNHQLLAAQEENAGLAVDNERSRFARDLHDILGHSLTVITVKAELAGRLLDAGSPEAAERARAEVADLERLSRDALADVRRAVTGYRTVTLPEELIRARMVLEAAGITAVLPGSVDDVPTQARELFAWTVREGVTNVVRHSRAHTCEVRLSETGAEVRDDGVGVGSASASASDGPGSGLLGLRERAAAAGATVVTERLSPGFALRVVLG
ncbi:sensor histidine kinase [Nocardioides plantarum]|uniref:Sensor histidine kinase n=1 Tax=Nocardioides plantarum TaxID=29299 RepID=A0ABV5KDJ5_9ACTN|nr:histidine kinase [Nocardioides plantarum]